MGILMNKTNITNNQELDSMKVAMRVSKISIVVNVLLAVAKLFAGIFARSGAMISDAVHSASDVDRKSVV